MAMQALRDGASGGVLKYFLLGILVLAAGGLVFTDVGGFFRGGVGSSDVAKIGKQTLPINTFDRQVRNALARLGMTPAQAHQVGYIREILNGEIRTSLLQQRASDRGVRVSTEKVAENIQKLLTPMLTPGQQPSAALEQLLRNQGISEQQLINSIRREMSVNLLGNAVQSGFLDVSETLVTQMARHEAETRNVEYILFKDKDFEGLKEPSDENLMELYEATKEAFATPETRKSQIIIINNKSLEGSLEISDEEIKQIYERNVSSYSEPERRKIEQVILSDAGQAEEIAEAVKGGQSLKDAVKKVTGNTTDYIPPKAQEKLELLDELQEPVFTAADKDVIGPIETGLGSHVLVLRETIKAHTAPFSDVKKEIREELKETRLLDAQYDLANTVDDYLAAGEPVETLKEDLGIEIQDMPAVNSYGMGKDGKAAFTAPFGPDAQTLIQSLFEMAEGEASPVMELADGRMAALLVTEITDKSYRPFEEMKDLLKKQWISDTRRAQNSAHVQALLDTAKAEGTDLKDLASAHNKTMQNIKGIKRSDKEKGPLKAAAIQRLFATPLQEAVVVNAEGGATIALVKKSVLPDNPDEQSITAARNKLMQTQQNEAYTLYVQSLQKDYGVKVNQKLLDSVYGRQSN